ncbi:hypothetical protein K503DRAFT_327579 [Rhizopogon vinicolor AM-OR11-026]|uniref:RNI-like protein n=1 Tax=Rhizopogon vinicolor AM-OR11-026 TaxID=1314800 RepID=A0A1B7NCU3_9AGAM|nr:hypothetical protein K503DRAFT_327579 [Rhizopogon vinicolor AM-OR11-026]
MVGNEVLKVLGLANLGPDHDALASFATKINQSRLEFLSLSGNPLGDAGIETLFRHLRTSHLQELHINTMGLTAGSASGLAEWISSRRSGHSDGVHSLHTLKCNGNSLGMNGVWKVIHAIQMGNRSLVKVELYANQTAGTEIPNRDTPFQQTS